MPAMKPKYEIGDAATVEIYGFLGQQFAAKVIEVRPDVKVEITEKHPIWFGCKISRDEGKIRKAKQAA